VRTGHTHAGALTHLYIIIINFVYLLFAYYIYLLLFVFIYCLPIIFQHDDHVRIGANCDPFLMSAAGWLACCLSGPVQALSIAFC